MGKFFHRGGWKIYSWPTIVSGTCFNSTSYCPHFAITLRLTRMNSFFTLYHPFLPLLDPEKSPDDYYDSSSFLFWTIITVAARRYGRDPLLLNALSGPVTRLLWATIADVPQNYVVVKALCIFCTWPLPISSTSSDPTFMLSALMMQISLQIGLHRPLHSQGFTKFRIELREEELKDRVRTWAACNAVAQRCVKDFSWTWTSNIDVEPIRVATGYGQPPSTVYDWTLAPYGSNEANFKLHEDVEAILLIERFCNRVTKALYSNHLDSVGLVDDAQRSILMAFLVKDYQDLEEKLRPSTSCASLPCAPLPCSPELWRSSIKDGKSIVDFKAKITNIAAITTLYLRAAGLHLHLGAFFDSSTSRDYNADLLALFLSTSLFLESAFALETSAGGVLAYATNYILQMVVAAGFTLLKLLNSFFAHHIDIEYGKTLFNRAIWAIRTISVATNDLPSRLAEVLAQLWRGGSADSRMLHNDNDVVDSSLQLKVRCRMSMSLVYDSVWRWREEFQAKGRGNLECKHFFPKSSHVTGLWIPTSAAIKNPTNPDSAVESSASSIADPPSNILGDTVTQGASDSFGEPNYNVFDPLGWLLDGFTDFPYSLSEEQGLT